MGRKRNNKKNQNQFELLTTQSDSNENSDNLKNDKLIDELKEINHSIKNFNNIFFSGEKEERVNFLIREQLEKYNVDYLELKNESINMSNKDINKIVSYFQTNISKTELEELVNFIGVEFQMDGCFIIKPHKKTNQEIYIDLDDKRIIINHLSVVIVETTISNSVEKINIKIKQVVRNSLIAFLMIMIKSQKLLKHPSDNQKFLSIIKDIEYIFPISIIATNTNNSESKDNYRNCLKKNNFSSLLKVENFINYIYKTKDYGVLYLDKLINHVYISSSYNPFVKIITKNAIISNNLLISLNQESKTNFGKINKSNKDIIDDQELIKNSINSLTDETKGINKEMKNIKKKIDSLETTQKNTHLEVKNLKNEIEILKTSNNNLKKEFGKMEKEFVEMKEKNGKMEKEFVEMKEEFGEMKNSLNKIMEFIVNLTTTKNIVKET